MKMKGGLLIKPEYKITEAFITFIKHSKIMNGLKELDSIKVRRINGV